MSGGEAGNLTLGEFLRQEREKRGITIEQVASATKIGVKTLHALEGDQYSELPAKPFVRGFVTSYARFVGLDPKEILTRFGSFIDSKAHDRPNRDAGHSGYAFEKREGEQSRTILWVVMGSFVVLGGVAAVFVKKPLGHHQHGGSQVDKLRAAYGASPSPGPSLAVTPSPNPSASVAAVPTPPPSSSAGPEASPTAVAIVAPAPSASPSVLASTAPLPTSIAAAPTPAPSAPAVAVTSAVPSAEESLEEGPNPEDPLNSGLKLKPSEIKYKVVFRANESAWVRYKVDHKPITQFVFRVGKTLVLRAKEVIRFQVSPPKALSFSYRGSGFKPVLGDQHLATRQNDATMVFPFELSDSIEEPFPGEKVLANRSVPAPRPAPSISPSNP